jgi:hypothetical protein
MTRWLILTNATKIVAEIGSASPPSTRPLRKRRVHQARPIAIRCSDRSNFRKSLD